MRHVQYAMRLAAIAPILALAACAPPSHDEEAANGAFRPINADAAGLWDRQTTETADVLGEIVSDFNAQYDGMSVKIVQSGNYADIYRKTTAAIKAGALPAMAVAYPSMTVEYADAGAVVDLRSFINDPKAGLSRADRDDFFPAVLNENQYDAFGGAMLSFPYTKSVLVMYVNTRVLGKAGIDHPPATWDEFLDQCRRVKRETGRFGLCFDLDVSTVNGMIFSRGGQILVNGVPRYDTPEALAVFDFLGTLFSEKLAYQNPPRSFNDQTAFGNDEIAFAFRPSSSLPYFRLVMEGNEGWLVARIPQTDPDHPATVLYGANISVFKTTPRQQQAAWAFLKYFTSPDVNVRWALKTGYLPYRKSAVDDPRLQTFWGEWPYNRTAFDCLAFARTEPNIEGWQNVRALLTDAITGVITGVKSPRQAQTDLQKQIDAAYAAR